MLQLGSVRIIGASILERAGCRRNGRREAQERIYVGILFFFAITRHFFCGHGLDGWPNNTLERSAHKSYPLDALSLVALRFCARTSCFMSPDGTV